VAYFPPETVASAALPDEGGRFSLFAAALRGCAGVVRGAFDLGPCLEGEFAFMSASGEAPSVTTFEPKDQLGRWISLGGGLLGSWSPSRALAVFVRGDALVPLARPSFVVSSGPSNDLVHRPAALAGRGALGLQLRFF
jgi:hypothetical protein